MIAAAVQVVLLTGFGWVLRGARWSRRGRPGSSRLAAAGAVQDAAVAVWVAAGCAGLELLGPAAWAAGVLLVGGTVGAAMWTDHLLSLWIGARLQPQAFASVNDLRNVWTSVRDLNLGDFAKGAIGVAAAALAVSVVFFERSVSGTLFLPLAAIAAVLTAAGLGLGRSGTEDHLAFLIAKPTPLTAALRRSADSVIRPRGDDPRFPLWRRHVPIARAAGRRPHVLLVLLESFAAQHVGMCGAAWGATPELDAWAARGLACPDAYGNGVQTVHGIVSALFGVPPRLSVRPMTLDARPPRLRGLPQILRDHGWHTAFWHAGDPAFHGQGPFLHAHGVAEITGDEDVRAAVDEAPPFGSYGLHDEALFAFVRGRLRRLSADDTPTLGVVLTLSHHHPWSAPPAWRARAFDGATGRLAAFLNSLAYADHCLGEFLRGLEEDGVLEHTAVVLAGDHGSPTGWGGESFDHFAHLGERGMRVPIAVIAPGLRTGIVADPVSLLDILPTVLDVVGVDARHHSLGDSLLRPLPGRAIPLSNPFGGGWLGARRGRHKIVFRPDRPVAALYDVVADPGEQRDLGGADPDLQAALAAECLDLHGAMERLCAADRLAPAPPDSRRAS